MKAISRIGIGFCWREPGVSPWQQFIYTGFVIGPLFIGLTWDSDA